MKDHLCYEVIFVSHKRANTEQLKERGELIGFDRAFFQRKL